MKKLLLISLLCMMSLSAFASCGVKFEGEIHGEVGNDTKSSSVAEVSEESSAEVDGDLSAEESSAEEEELSAEADIPEESDDKDVNFYASTLAKAVNSALVDIDEYGMDFKNEAVICSDSSKNINDIPENASSGFDFIQNEVKVFFNAIDDYEYIIVINDGECKNIAIKNPSEDAVGVYPKGEFEGMNFDEIYNEITKNISPAEADVPEESDDRDLNSIASMLNKAINSSITDIDEDGMYFKNDAVICSDSSKNINAVPENAGSDFDFIQDEVKVFFNAIDDYEYMILIQDGKCTKTAVRQGDMGTYPKDAFEGMTFDEIYEEMKKSIE